MLIHKKLLRPIWRTVYPFIKAAQVKTKSFNVPLNKLLCGGENGIRAFKYAELTNNFLRPSTSIFCSPHVQLLQLYDEIGNKIFTDDIFQSTHYYKNAAECMQLTGAYFYDRPEKIKTLAERFIQQYNGKIDNLPLQPGQSDPDQPTWVRPIKYSSCYEVIDGNHRIARAIMQGKETISALVYEKESVLTPLQQLLLDCLWINKQKWLYQPVDFPELKDEWQLVRNCKDRLSMMESFLKKTKKSLFHSKGTYIDLGSSYGWFVSEMSRLGLDAFGMERDPFGMEIGFKVYDLKRDQIIHRDIVLGLEELISQKKKYNVVSCLSVLHHFALQKSSTSAETFIKLLDKITEDTLFLDTGEEHETAFGRALQGWNPEFIKKWIKKNTTFKDVIPLGIDQDRQGVFKDYYNRTLFACVK
jgi:2-polyprenyl-3-methyl-5-hydroxy-6-metoxy-1,4-benzoquinol methylase